MKELEISQSNSEKRSQVIVEINSHTKPSFEQGKRQINENEFYVTVNQKSTVATAEKNLFGQRSDFSPIVGQIEDLPFPNNSVDELILRNTFSRLPGSYFKTLIESSRVIKPGGQMIIIETKKPNSKWAEALGSTKFEKYGLKLLSKTNDLDSLEIYSSEPEIGKNSFKLLLEKIR